MGFSDTTTDFVSLRLPGAYPVCFGGRGPPGSFKGRQKEKGKGKKREKKKEEKKEKERRGQKRKDRKVNQYNETGAIQGRI